MPNASIPTTSVKPVAPGTTFPLRYQTVVLAGLAGVTVAVSVVVINGVRVVVGEAAMLIVGCVFTVTVTLAQRVVLQVPSALTK